LDVERGSGKTVRRLVLEREKSTTTYSWGEKGIYIIFPTEGERSTKALRKKNSFK